MVKSMAVIFEQKNLFNKTELQNQLKKLNSNQIQFFLLLFLLLLLSRSRSRSRTIRSTEWSHFDVQETSLGLLLVPGDEVLVRFELRLLRIGSRCFAPRNTLNAKLRNPPDGAVVQGVHGVERCNTEPQGHYGSCYGEPG